MNTFKYKRYNQYSRHLENIFGCKIYKITLDAGFNCPNRDGTISKGGCIFCDEGGSFSRVHSNLLSLEEQIQTGISHSKIRYKAKKFISYFQAFTNTYASLDVLRDVYSRSLNHKDIIGLSIGTRPDCIDSEKIDLLSSYAEKHYVWVEYGLQSIHDKTLKLINRGHTSEDFIKAVKLTQNRGINICAHVIIGLPGETKEDILQTAKALADLGINGIKMHVLCALKGTELENMYYKEEFKPLAVENFVEFVCDFLEILSPDITIHRLAGSGLNEILVAPIWLTERFKVLTRIDRELEKRDSWQGKFYKQTL